MAQKFGIVTKRKVAVATKAAIDATDWLINKGCSVIVDCEAADFIKERNKIQTLPKEELPTNCDFIIVFGGDGTFLSVARQMIWKSIPIIGINAGNLGFLTEIKLSETKEILELVLANQHSIQSRNMIEACVEREDSQLFCLPALNDVVINKSAIARIINLELFINEVFVANVLADGLIVATPTGSTAYSLAAGGPLTHPQVNANIITSICPHSLTIRPIVVPSSAKIDIKLTEKVGDIMLTLDGQFGYDLQKGDIISVKNYNKHQVQVVQSPKRKYFDLLQSKFSLGARGD